MTQFLKEMWDQEVNGHTQWSVIRDSMVEACNEFLKKGRRKQPDWFSVAESFLRPLIDIQNVLFSRWLSSGRDSDRQKYLSQRRHVASAVRSSKIKWLQEKAQ